MDLGGSGNTAYYPDKIEIVFYIHTAVFQVLLRQAIEPYMPELPEVETTRQGISPHICGHKVISTDFRQKKLRWPVDSKLGKILANQQLTQIERRGKYLLLLFSSGTLIWHLGMSGSLRITNAEEPPSAHDHIDLIFSNGNVLRYRDPRRFGAAVWTEDDPLKHKLLHHLGPEPLTESFTDIYLFERSRNIRQPVKSWIMNNKIVVGVGNIYANESLFSARIHPLKAAGKLTRPMCSRLTQEIKSILSYAIEQGGTTLKDFVGGDGQPGYFSQKLMVYGRGGQSCSICQNTLLEKPVAQRATVYCRHCQK